MASASASSATRLCVLACRQAPRLQTLPPRIQRLARPYPAARRAFTTSPARREDEPPKHAQQPASEDKKPAAAEPESAPSGGIPDPTSQANSSAPENTLQPIGDVIDLKGLEVLDITAKEHGYGTFNEFVREELKKGPDAPRLVRDFYRNIMEVEDGHKVDRKSFWYDPDDPEPDTEEVEEFDEDDMTEMAHAKLEEIKEMRQYARLAVWELPLLSKFAKPFEPPTERQVLRWRYTTYMGDTHPAEKKVVVQFSPDDLGLTKVQAEKLKKLAGARYNPETELVKMSYEGYEHQAQNKRYLANLVDRLVAEAKDSKDTFEDVPLDTRHHKTTTKPRFPKEWLMTEERKKFLAENRERQMLAEVQRVEAGQLVDGKQAIETYLLEKMAHEQLNEDKVPERVAAPAKSNARSMGKAKKA